MDDRTAYVDSAAILTVVDELVGRERASLARHGEDAHASLRIAGFAAGVADKGVSLLYERVLREQALPLWVDRCRLQIVETLDLLEAERQLRPTRYLFDEALSHADVMLTTMWGLLEALVANSSGPDGRARPMPRFEALLVFQRSASPSSSRRASVDAWSAAR